ncbi:Hypothetical predicted protein [Mytilus galloprovincialis]|uniref:XK-related protein n=1 Tax=Mytilus galloprovincialis TaxID=29158 RepID=A0A8B6EUI3_MYTGA|nr:Hypothetical predicted protein [Mytilus galloprovincialis]
MTDILSSELQETFMDCDRAQYVILQNTILDHNRKHIDIQYCTQDQRVEESVINGQTVNIIGENVPRYTTQSETTTHKLCHGVELPIEECGNEKDNIVTDPLPEGCSGSLRKVYDVFEDFFLGFWWKSIKSFDPEEYRNMFRAHTLVTAVLCISFFYYDIVSDILLAIQYYNDGNFRAFIFTTAFIALPLFVVNVMNIYLIINRKHCSWEDSKQFFISRGKKIKITQCIKANKQTNEINTQRKFKVKNENNNVDEDESRESNDGNVSGPLAKTLRCLVSFPLLSGTVDRTFTHIYHGIKSRSKFTNDKMRKKHYTYSLENNAAETRLKIIEAFMEATPQLILQIYFTLTAPVDEDISTQMFRAASMLGSWISVTASVLAYTNAMYDLTVSKVSVVYKFLRFVQTASGIGLRIVLIPIFTVEFGYYVIVIVLSHWLIMVVTLLYRECTRKSTRIKSKRKAVFLSIVSYRSIILIFTSATTAKRHLEAIRGEMLYNVLVYVENMTMFALWISTTLITGLYYNVIIRFIATLEGLRVGSFFIRHLYKCMCAKRKLETDL